MASIVRAVLSSGRRDLVTTGCSDDVIELSARADLASCLERSASTGS